jgi:hypothetical protein
MSEATIISNPRLRITAMKDWEKVKSIDDVKLWHKVYTPWWTDQEIEMICKLYDKKLQDPTPDDLIPVETVFEKMLKISK